MGNAKHIYLLQEMEINMIPLGQSLIYKNRDAKLPHNPRLSTFHN